MFLISAKNIDREYSLEPPRPMYLNLCVFVMMIPEDQKM